MPEAMRIHARFVRPDRGEIAARERLAVAGRRLGLYPMGPGPAAPRWLAVPTFAGDRISVRAGLRGHVDGLELEAFELIVARRGRPVHHACVQSRIAANVPRLSIDPTASSPGSVAVGIAAIDREGLRFEREYRTSAVDRAYASRFLGLSTMRWFMDRPRPRLHFVAEGPNVGCSTVTTPGEHPLAAGLAELVPLMVESLSGFGERLMATAFPERESPSYSRA